MPVLINFKICDNSVDCNGIAVCPTKAFHWDEKKKTIVVDESKCAGCGKCGTCCPVDAIKFAKDEAEYKRMKKEIDEDPRKQSDLFVDRYGATPVHPAFKIPQESFEVQILKATNPAVVELFRPAMIKCLLHSIPIKELMEGNIKYRKIEAKDDSLLQKYEVKQLPALLFFVDGKLVGKVEGYYDSTKKKELKGKVKKILAA